MPDDKPKNVVKFQPREKAEVAKSAEDQAKAAHKKEMMQRLVDGGRQLRLAALAEHALYYVSVAFTLIFLITFIVYGVIRNGGL